MKSERAGGTWLLLAVLALIWGSSFILMKRGLYHEGIPVLTPWQMATARLSIAWLALSPLLLRHGSLLLRRCSITPLSCARPALCRAGMPWMTWRAWTT